MPNPLKPRGLSKLQPRSIPGIYLGFVPRVGSRFTNASLVVSLDEFHGRSLLSGVGEENNWKPYVNKTEEIAVVPPG
eukprot:10117648-Prorocentrum_lima.AAC.1